MPESFLEALLDNIFRVLPDMCVSQHNTKDLLPVTFEESFKCLFVSVLVGNDEHLLRCRISQASNSWFCAVVHKRASRSAMGQRKRAQSLEHCLSATCRIKARPAPNLQNRKSLNFQDKIDRKSKVSKLRRAAIVKIATHDAIWPEDVALAVGRQTNTLVLRAQATHFSQRFKAYLSVKIRGDVFANPLERGLHAHTQKAVHQRFSFLGARKTRQVRERHG